MTTDEFARIVGRALALLLLFISLENLVYAVPDLLSIARHWVLAAKGSGDVYFLRYYVLFFAGHIFIAAIMLYVANELRRGSPKLIGYLSGRGSKAN